MEDEKILTGYCRCMDAHRMVTAEQEACRWYADCAYPDCPHQAACEIGKQLLALDSDPQ